MKIIDKQITFSNNPIQVYGEKGAIQVGDTAPAFVATNQDLSPFTFKGGASENVYVFSVVPSINTPVCAKQTVKFNEIAQSVNAKIITISVDLPFAEAAFCTKDSITKTTLISDYKTLEFGTQYGFLWKEHRLLTRGIVVVDKTGIVRYVEYVPEVTNEPDYDALIEVLKTL